MNEDNFLDFVSKKLLIKRDKLHINLSLNFDLGIEGIDAINFIHEYSINYNVDISNFNYDNYFLDEGFDSFAFIKHIFGKKYIPKQSLTLYCLFQGILKGNL